MRKMIFVFVCITFYFSMLFASALSDLAASMQPGTWAELTTNNINQVLGSNGSSKGITSYANSAAWDPVSRQIFFCGGDHNDVPRFVTYHDETNTWEELPWPPAAVFGNDLQWHGYDQNTVDPVNQEYFNGGANGGRTVYRYKITTRDWSALPATPITPSRSYGAHCFFPELNGLVSAVSQWGDPAGVYLYRKSTNQWTLLSSNINIGKNVMIEYNPVHKVVIFGSGSSIYKLDSTGTVTSLNSPAKGFSVTSSQLCVDPVTGTYLMLGDGGTFYHYNVKTDTWTSQSSSPVSTMIQTINVPITNYGVAMFIERTSSAPRFKVHLYKLAQSTQLAGRVTLSNIPSLINHPNPFNLSTRIRFTVPQTGRVSLQIFDVKGHWVKTVFQGMAHKVNSTLSWNATDNKNKKAAPGIYFMRLNAGIKIMNKKILVIR